MSDSRPTLELRPPVVVHGNTLQIAGAGWPLDAIVITFGKQERAPDRVLAGSLYGGLLVPSGDGTFLVEYATESLAPGSIGIRERARASCRCTAPTPRRRCWSRRIEDAISVAFGPKKFRFEETKVPKRAEKARDALHREQIYTFDVMQVAGGRIAGGYTVQLADLGRMTASRATGASASRRC